MRHLRSVIIAIGLAAAVAVPAFADTWTAYSDIGPTLLARETSYPNLCKRYDLGTTLGGRHLWALKITTNVNVEADKPEFRYVSTLNGDEIVGVKMCMNLIDYLLTNYGTVPRVTNIVDNIELWVLPLANPDGYDRSPRTRGNNNGTDLNRDFPEGSGSSPDPDTNLGRQLETIAIMDWTKAHTFNAGVNFHGGALVVNYPFDNDGLGSVDSPSPDDDVFEYTSVQYSQYNTPMYTNPSFQPYGITNGAAWYTIDGGMQDYCYRYHAENHVTIELSNTKEPAASEIPTFWSQNQNSMLTYLETCLIGIRGIVTDGNTGAPLAATVTVSGRNHNIYTDPDVGDYHRELLPGTYTLNVTCPGYSSVSIPGIVVTSGAATVHNVQMYGPTYVTYPNGGESLPAGTPATVTWSGDLTAQYHVQYTQNYGATAPITDDFERSTLGANYTTGGNQPWFITTTSYHGATRSARSGAIGNSQTTWMTRTVSGTSASFWYRVSSESGYDFFNFYVDSTRLIHTSGTVAWNQYTTPLTAGSHVLKWEYTKDAGSTGGTDTCYVDDLQLLSDVTAWSDIIALTSVGAQSTPWTPITPGTAYKVRVQTYKSGAYGAYDESNATFSVAGSTGSCCQTDGSCTVTQQAQCSGTWTASGTCSPNTCPQPSGSCCQTDASCTETLQANCSGTWTMFGTCNPNICPQPSGSCCQTDGSCTETLQANCSGTWTMFGTCNPNTCQQPSGSCCQLDSTCTETLQAQCSASWTMFGTCTPNPCSCTRLGDINGDSVTDGLDIQAFVDALLGTPTQAQICQGDFSPNGALDVDDVPGLVNILLGL